MTKPDFSWQALQIYKSIAKCDGRQSIVQKLTRGLEVAYENGKKDSVEEDGLCYVTNVLFTYISEWNIYEVTIVYSNGSTISKDIKEELLTELIDTILK